MSQTKVSIFWFRRDLRLEDNTALYFALKESCPIQPIFIFDTEILDDLEDKNDARVSFLYQELAALNSRLKTYGTTLDVRYGKPFDVWRKLLEDYDIVSVFANRDYEPYAIQRDKEIYNFLNDKGIKFIGKKDHVIFEKDEITKGDGSPYVVYTPYSRVWKENLGAKEIQEYDSLNIANWHQLDFKEIISLSEMGFENSNITFPGKSLNTRIVEDYHNSRDIPSVKGTSRMGLHLRFGTVSIRKLVRDSKDINTKYLNELIWRDFYSSILWNFPHVVTGNFSKKFDRVAWRNDEEEFKRWCIGSTGYPIVDAGMRELNTTGFMHNRVRMIVASFLTKHLLIDWRWGEAYFAKKLLDYDLASNNGGWQWAAGTGVDAAPYFRVFNPYLQTEKFDPSLNYVKHWVPELNTPDYPKAIVDHKMARERAIETYKAGLSS